LAIATAATAQPMGAQVYEREISSRAGDALEATGHEWHVEHIIARSLRSDLDGTVRIPARMLERGGRLVRRTVGRFVYPKNTLVHRMGLTLPPAEHEVITLHDVVAWRFPDEGTPIASAPEEMRAAAAVICVSRATAADAVEMFDLENVRIVHEGVDDRFRDPAPLDPSTRARLGLDGPYILHAGGASERKNLGALAGAWARIAASHPEVRLALSGPPHPRRTELFRQLPRVSLLGRVDAALVPSLIAGAEAVVVPSLHEGFGLPVLEAMAAGTAVVAADTSSLPEVAGGAALLVPPDGAGIAEGLVAVLGGQVDVQSLVERGRRRAAEFTWGRCAAEHAAVWNEVAV
jgi:glycosyltransferase involved in cell wall biosynthesis